MALLVLGLPSLPLHITIALVCYCGVSEQVILRCASVVYGSFRAKDNLSLRLTRNFCSSPFNYLEKFEVGVLLMVRDYQRYRLLTYL